MVFGARLRAARTALGLTRLQAADTWAISRRTLEAWEAGRKLPAPRARGYVTDIINEVEASRREGRRPAGWVGGLAVRPPA